jgi:hypothetical protein
VGQALESAVDFRGGHQLRFFNDTHGRVILSFVTAKRSIGSATAKRSMGSATAKRSTYKGRGRVEPGQPKRKQNIHLAMIDCAARKGAMDYVR